MEAIYLLVLLIIGAAVFVLPILAVLRAYRASGLAQQTRDQLAQLTGRVYALEQQVLTLIRAGQHLESLLQEIRQAPTQEAAKERPPVPPLVPPAKPAAEQPVPAPPPREAVAVGPARAPASPPRRPPAPSLPVAAPPAQAHPPTFATARSLAESLVAKAEGRSLEEILGTNWLNKLGIIILVLGVAFFLAYQLRTLGPAGKILVGYSVSAALLGAGIYFERKDRYRILARAGIGGGWALLFFTTYAMYHVRPSRVIDSQALDLVLMLMVAAGMVAHTLRYRSQVVTGLAFLLAFTTVTISHVSVYSLSASALLAAALVVIVWRMRWFELEIFGMLATFLNHWYWLRPIIEPMGKHHHSFPEFPASATLLVLYWALFRISYIVRRVEDQREESVSTVAALLNTCLLLGIMKYQSVRPELAFWFLLGVGAVELALGQLPHVRRWRAAFVNLSSLGATLLVAAIPFKYSGGTLRILWLAEAEALFLAGVFTGEVLFRRLGMLAMAALAAIVNKTAYVHLRDANWPGLQAADWGRDVIVFVTTGLAFYGNSHWVSARYAKLLEKGSEQVWFRVSSYVAALVVFMGIGCLAPEAWVVVGWSVVGLACAFAGRRLDNADLINQANLFAALSVARALVANLHTPGAYFHVSVRLITILLVALLLYLGARWTRVVELAKAQRIPGAYTWAGSMLITVLMWYEFRPAAVALGWSLFALLLFEWGLAQRALTFRLQAYVALGAGFLRLFFVNLNAEAAPGELSPRLYTTLPVALVCYYFYDRLVEAPGDSLEREHRWKAPDLACYLGTVAVAGWMRFEVGLDWVAGAWAALALVLAAVAWKTSRRIFLHQSYLVAAGVLFRTVLHNFYERSYFAMDFLHSRWLSVGITAGLLFLTLPLAFALRQEEAPPAAGQGKARKAGAALDRHPEQIFFFVPVLLLTVLLALEMRSGMVTMAWAVEAVVVFVFALGVGQRSFRLTGLGLLLLCAAKIVVVDVWGLTPRDRYLTFIVLGSILLLVSFLYSRYREALRNYL